MCVCVHVTIRGVDTEVDGDRGDALVGAGETLGLCFNLLTDFFKVHKLAALTVQELGIFYMVKMRNADKRDMNKRCVYKVN